MFRALGSKECRDMYIYSEDSLMHVQQREGFMAAGNQQDLCERLRRFSVRHVRHVGTCFYHLYHDAFNFSCILE